MKEGKAETSIKKMQGEAFKRFNVAFGLMTVIPILICVYLVTVRFFSITFLLGTNGLYFLLIIVIALLGLLYGRDVIWRIFRKLSEATVKLEKLVEKEAGLNEKLKQEVAEHEGTQERLRLTQDHLIQIAKIESVGQLAAGAAHEVKNPLTMLMLGVDYLRSSVPPKDDKTRYMLVQMESAVRKADSVLRDLLDYASVAELKMSDADLSSVVEQALSLVKHELDRSHIRVSRHYQSEIPKIKIDQNRMQQVFVNLFTNAIHAMPDGGELTVKIYPRRLNEIGATVGRRLADCFRLGETTMVAVIQDTGKGIPEDQLSRIFDPFFTTRRSQGGTGLGLSVVRNIVDVHRGFIDVRNRKDHHGTEATIMLKV